MNRQLVTSKEFYNIWRRRWRASDVTVDVDVVVDVGVVPSTTRKNVSENLVCFAQREPSKWVLSKKILWTQFQSIKKPLILRQFVKWHLVKWQFVILQIFSPKDYLQNAVCQKTLSQMTLSQMTVCDITDIFPTDYFQNAVCQKTFCLVIVEFNFLTIGSITNKYFF